MRKNSWVFNESTASYELPVCHCLSRLLYFTGALLHDDVSCSGVQNNGYPDVLYYKVCLFNLQSTMSVRLTTRQLLRLTSPKFPTVFRAYFLQDGATLLTTLSQLDELELKPRNTIPYLVIELIQSLFWSCAFSICQIYIINEPSMHNIWTHYWPNKIPRIFSWSSILPKNSQYACWLGMALVQF